MTTALGAATVDLWDALKAESGQIVTYRRSGTSISLTALAGFRRTAQVGLAGLQDTFVNHDFIVRRSDLGSLGLPAAKDEIDWIDDVGTARTLIVLPIADERVYDPVDQQQTLLRVHTKEK